MLDWHVKSFSVFAGLHILSQCFEKFFSLCNAKCVTKVYLSVPFFPTLQIIDFKPTENFSQ